MLDGVADAYFAGHDHDLEIFSMINGVDYIVDGAGGKTRASGVGDNTIFAVGRAGFMAFLVSRDEMACRVIDAEGHLIFSCIDKTKTL